MSGGLVRLLMVFLVCSTVSLFFITSCSLKKFEKLTTEERTMKSLQDAYEACLRQSGSKSQEDCVTYIQTLKGHYTTPPLNKPDHKKEKQNENDEQPD